MRRIATFAAASVFVAVSTIGVAAADDISSPAPAPLAIGDGASTTAPNTTQAAGGTGSGSTSGQSGSAQANTGQAAGQATPGATTAADLTAGRAAIDKKDWAGALTVLTRAATADPKNADVQNLLGYVSRNMGDHKKALTYYAAALKLNPKHTGALEYRGEAYVKVGDITKAKADLAALKRICGTKCEQYIDLSKAIASYKPAAKAKTK